MPHKDAGDGERAPEVEWVHSVSTLQKPCVSFDQEQICYKTTMGISQKQNLSTSGMMQSIRNSCARIDLVPKVMLEPLSNQ